MHLSAADLHDLEFTWPSLGPTDVVATGTFDQWSSSIHLVKGDSGFFGTVKVPWGQKIAYKYIVDGIWQCRDDQPQEYDEHGNTNNVVLTPERPAASPTAHDPPARLSIPLESVPNEGHGDVENMVTAVEFLPPHEPAAIKGSLPLPIPQITVNLSQTPVSELKLDTAAATEGNVSPSSVTPEVSVPSSQVRSSSDVPVLPINDKDSVSLPLVNGNGEAHESHTFSTHAPVQFAKGAAPATVPVKEDVVVPPEPAVPQPELLPQTVQDIPPVADRTDVPSPSVVDSTAKQLGKGQPESITQGHRRQATAPASIGQASTASTSPSNALTQKKRRSLFARIKQIFDKDKEKDKDKQGKKG